MAEVSVEAAMSLDDPYQACGLQILINQDLMDSLPSNRDEAAAICDVETCEMKAYKKSEDTFAHFNDCAIVHACVEQITLARNSAVGKLACLDNRGGF